jgi:ATP-binding cassette subfamily B protein
MTDASHFADRPLALIFCYARRRLLSHMAILVAVLAAVGCSVSTQYGVKALVDALSRGPRDSAVWAAFALLVGLIAADNLLWRAASWTASFAFVAVTGDLRRDLFRHLTGHAPSYFADRPPGVLTSRVTATSNAIFTIENMFMWNVLPPCAATVGAIAFIASVSVAMSAGLIVVASVIVVVMFRLAAAGKPLHHDFAAKAAAVDGEMVDVIGNMPLVMSFGALAREHSRYDTTVGKEMAARRRSLIYLEKVRVFHAVVTITLTLALLAWAIMLWQRGAATTGQVVLVCTLGLTVLSATRDLAIALVDVTQHLARLSEAVKTLLVPHELTDHPAAASLIGQHAGVSLEDVSFSYPDGRQVFEGFTLDILPGERVGLVGPSGGGKTTLFALLQRFYDIRAGRILINGQDIARVTQASLHEAIAVVPQDISMFHRSLLDNIRYGRPEATRDEVMAAALAARCTDFIDELPQGIDTVVGNRGVKLSGGQRQRVAIARAFLKDAPILLLDEATSSLDSDSEEAIKDALDRLMTDRTVIAIAHRLSTVNNFDRIIVLEAGRIVEDGPPDKLLRRPGHYRRLVARQMGTAA